MVKGASVPSRRTQPSRLVKLPRKWTDPSSGRMRDYAIYHSYTNSRPPLPPRAQTRLVHPGGVFAGGQGPKPEQLALEYDGPAPLEYDEGPPPPLPPRPEKKPGKKGKKRPRNPAHADYYYAPYGEYSHLKEDLAGYYNPGVRKKQVESIDRARNGQVDQRELVLIRKRIRQLSHSKMDLSSKDEGCKVPLTKSVRERNVFEMRDLCDRVLEVGGYTNVNKRYYQLGQNYQAALVTGQGGTRVRIPAPPDRVPNSELEAHDQMDARRMDLRLNKKLIPWNKNPFAPGFSKGYNFF